MNIKIYFCLIIACKVTTVNSWIVKDEGDCFYTVISKNPSAIVTNKISMCAYVEPYVTIIITNSTHDNVTSNYFNTTFNSWIRHLKAFNNSWSTVYPFVFSSLKNVLYIDLSGNHIKNINKAFKGLEVLDFLNLSRNHIEDVNSDTFMISENETRLHLLDLSYNLLSYLPENLFVNVHNLRMLYLQGNKISVLDDELFRSTKRIIYINLCCNNITVLGKIKNLSFLTDLDLSYNNIASIDNNTFTDLISLQSVDLSHNNNKLLDVSKEPTSLLDTNLGFNKANEISSDILSDFVTNSIENENESTILR